MVLINYIMIIHLCTSVGPQVYKANRISLSYKNRKLRNISAFEKKCLQEFAVTFFGFQGKINIG